MSAKSKIRKMFTALWITVAVVPLLLLAIVAVVLVSQPVQTYITAKVSEILSERFGTDISVSKVFVNVFNLSVDFKDIYVADLNKDTLLYVGSVEARLKSFGIRNNYYHFSQARIENVVVNMIADSSGSYNYSYLVPPSDSLDVDTISTKSKFSIEIDKLKLGNINFCRSAGAPQTKDYLMDFENLKLTNVNLLGKNFSINEKIGRAHV